MGTLSREAILLCLILSPCSIWFNSYLKEFAPSRSKFFPLRVDPLVKGFIVEESKHEILKLILNCVKVMEKRGGVHIHLNVNSNTKHHNIRTSSQYHT